MAHEVTPIALAFDFAELCGLPEHLEPLTIMVLTKLCMMGFLKKFCSNEYAAIEAEMRQPHKNEGASFAIPINSYAR